MVTCMLLPLNSSVCFMARHLNRLSHSSETKLHYPKPNDHIYYKKAFWSKANCPLADMYGLLSEKD